MNTVSTEAGRLPSWAVNRAPLLGRGDALKRRLRRARLVTVCEEARCPNLGDCFGRGTATFMLLGDRCTRACRFCSVRAGRPLPPDPDEGRRIAEAVERLGLRYVVLTSVARDDLEDEGASAFSRTIEAIRARTPGVGVEVLTPDFHGRADLIGRVTAAAPEVFGHNLETVERLTREVRGRADYRRSLEVLAEAAGQLGSDGLVKSGLMVGLGESRRELFAAMHDLRDAGCRLLTVGQYLRPTRRQRPVTRYVPPEEFAEIEAEARTLGFDEVACGPLVRSSYRAESLYGSVGVKK